MAPAIIMKYQEFVDSFIKSDIPFMAYQQDRYFVRVVKVPVAENVYVLYASCTFRSERNKEGYNFEFSDKMEAIGFIDCHKNLRFPTFEFTHNMVDDGESVTVEKSAAVLARAIRDEVNKLASKVSLPACPNEKFAYQQACEIFFLAEKARPLPMHSDFSYYINDSTIIDYLTDTPGWAEVIAKKWAADFGTHREGGDLTNLEVFCEDLAHINKVQEFIEAIKADETHKIHRYIAMKKAVEAKDAKTVIVEFKTANGGIGSVKVPAASFRKGYQDCIERIALYDITPYHESERVANLLPKVKTADGREYKASNLPKDNIVAIKYGRHTIWSDKEES